MSFNLGAAPVFKNEVADVRPEVTTAQVVDLGSVAVNELVYNATNFSYDKAADVTAMVEKSVVARKFEADQEAAAKNMSTFQEAMILSGAEDNDKKKKDKTSYDLAA